MCRKIDALCDWPYGYKKYESPITRTQEQKNRLNIIIEKQIKETEELGRIFYKGK